MLAAVLSGYNDFKLKEVDKPRIQKGTDILLKVTGCSICTSEVHTCEGLNQPITRPLIGGHEFVGIVAETGSDVKKLNVGDHVAVCCFSYDNSCIMCKSGHTGHCINGGLFGTHFDGALAEYVVVPYGDVNCTIIPDNVSEKEAILVGDMLATAYTGVELANVKSGDTVAVFGLGAVGLSSVAVAKAFNPKTIIGVGRRKERLNAALECGADYVIDIDKENVVERVKEITGGDPIWPGGPFQGYVNSCIDSCGVKKATDEQIQILKVGGIISQLGMPAPEGYPININLMCMKDITMKCALATNHNAQMLMNLVADGKINVKPIVTHEMPLADFDRAYDMFANKKDGCIKVMLRP